MVISPKQYAGFWRRFWAFYIDQLILLALIAVIEKLSMLSAGYASANLIKQVVASFVLSIAFGYFTLLESSRLQATVGKKVMGLRVTDTDNNRISVLRSAGRTLAKIPSFLFSVLAF